MESQSIAESLARTGQFANPFRTPTGPTAHLAPAHPLLLAGLMTLFPNDSSYETAKQVLSSLAASLLYAILPLAALALGLARRAGLIAGWLGIAVFLFLPRNV